MVMNFSKAPDYLCILGLPGDYMTEIWTNIFWFHPENDMWLKKVTILEALTGFLAFFQVFWRPFPMLPQ